MAEKLKTKNDTKTKLARRLLLAGTALSTLSAPISAVAQDAGNDQTGLEEIIVEANRYFAEQSTNTTSRVNIDLQELPNSISLISADSIQDRNATTIEEIVGTVAGATPTFSGRLAYFNRINLRGAGGGEGLQFNVREEGLAGGVNYPADPYSYERVEIIKGPSSITGGIVTPGGFINNVLKKAKFEDFSGDVGFSVTDFGKVRAQGDVNTSFGSEDQYAARVVATGSFGDNFYDGTDSHSFQILPSFAAQLGEKTDVSLVFNAVYLGETPFDGVPVNFNGPLVLPDASFNLNQEGVDGETTNFGVSGEIVHRFLDDLTLTARFGANESDIEKQTIYAYTYNYFEYAAYGYDGTGLPANGFAQVFASNLRNTTNRYTFDLFLTKTYDTAGGESSITIGTEYLNSSDFFFLQFFRFDPGEAGGFNIFDPTLTFTYPGVDAFPADPFRNVSTDFELISGYAQTVIRPIENLTLTGGIRVDSYDAESIPVGGSGGGAFDTDVSETQFTWRIGGSYLVEAINTNVYASYATGFTPQPFAATFDDRLLDAETSEQFEIGFKTELFGGNAFLTIAAYRLKQDGTTIADTENLFLDQFVFFSVNGGETQIDGLEIEFAGEVIPGLDISFGIGFRDPEITVGDLDAGQVAGDQIGQTSKFNAGAVISYEIQEGIAKGLRFGGSARAVGERSLPTFVDPQGRTDGFATGSLFAEYTYEGYKLGLFVNNITDELFVETSRFPNNSFLGLGRNFTFRASKSF